MTQIQYWPTTEYGRDALCLMRKALSIQDAGDTTDANRILGELIELAYEMKRRIIVANNNPVVFAQYYVEGA